jgi:hypothetical protein
MFSHQYSEAQSGLNTLFPTTRFKEVRMKWLLLLMILSGYSGPSKVTVNFDS